ncbi:hypothetical protein QN277_025184 [Acacia crassicarpa]|nr:hypothetical protein QN277_025184 [Acacia crassicarpa]
MAELQKSFKASLLSMSGLLLLVLLCLHITARASMAATNEQKKRLIPVGVILDLHSALGSMVNGSLALALEDYYSVHTDTATKIDLKVRNASHDNVLDAAKAAWDLVKKENVTAILGPENSEEARYVVDLGNTAYVPVIWFSPSGPSLLPPRTRFFITSDSTRSHCSQFEAIAAIIKAYNWQSVIPIYEEPQFGDDLIPCLYYALQDMDTQVPYISAIRQNFTDVQITKELDMIKDKRTYVFVAHMTVELWSRLVQHAKSAGLVDKGCAWILTQGLSSVLDPKALNIKVKGYMDGALGVRPSLADSNITKRVELGRRIVPQYGKSLSLYGLWAYDTITALANAVEKAGLANSDESRGDLRNETGPELLKAILSENFTGLSGNFNLSLGQLEPSQFVIYNVQAKRDIIFGNWSHKTGLVPDASVIVEWPGNAKERPPKLKIGVPKTHFTEFAGFTVEGQNVSATGFAVELFKQVVDVLPFPLPYEFVPLNSVSPSSYDDLLCQMKDKNVDVLIGDITVVASRKNCVDFTMPYLDSRLSIVVKVRSDSDSKNGGTFLEPFSRSIWLSLAVGVAGAAVTVSVIIFEIRKMNEGSNWHPFFLNPLLIYVSGVDILKSRTSKWVMVLVMFVLGIAMQVYTAYLSSILSERTMAKPSPWRDLQDIKRNNGSLGYQKDSWVKDLLIDQIKLKDHQLKALGSLEEYNEALSNGTVGAIFDETPYLKLFLSKCPSCKMTGPIYSTGGFAFAFPNNSILVPNFSAAILKVTQNVTAFHEMKKSISLPDTIDKSEYKSDVDMRSLTKEDFGGLFPIIWSVLALFMTILILKVPPIPNWLSTIYAISLLLSGCIRSILVLIWRFFKRRWRLKQ